jgi:hypothetical protein
LAAFQVITEGVADLIWSALEEDFRTFFLPAFQGVLQIV